MKWCELRRGDVIIQPVSVDKKSSIGEMVVNNLVLDNHHVITFSLLWSAPGFTVEHITKFNCSPKTDIPPEFIVIRSHSQQ